MIGQTVGKRQQRQGKKEESGVDSGWVKGVMVIIKTHSDGKARGTECGGGDN